MKKWNYATQINNPLNHHAIFTQIESLLKDTSIQVAKKKVRTHLPSRAIILDFEGNPVFLIGLMIDNLLLSFYIKDFKHRTKLYLLLLEIFSTFEEMVYFTFSDHEKEEIKKICQYLGCQGFDLSHYIPVNKIPIINLQINRFESVLEALYSVQPNMKITGDALFRNTKMIDQLFYAKKYCEIVKHNQNCLENESIILKKRWLKLYTV